MANDYVIIWKQTAQDIACLSCLLKQSFKDGDYIFFLCCDILKIQAAKKKQFPFMDGLHNEGGERCSKRRMLHLQRRRGGNLNFQIKPSAYYIHLFDYGSIKCGLPRIKAYGFSSFTVVHKRLFQSRATTALIHTMPSLSATDYFLLCLDGIQTWQFTAMCSL